MKIPFPLPRQAWFAVFGMGLLLALGWVATKSGRLLQSRRRPVPVAQ
ncbi:MAG: hypothetical protein J0M13_16220 [Candidatus Accumulibacter sp.]|nr:hypothetical protein [Candidatus Accumulibacter necessarius]